MWASIISPIASTILGCVSSINLRPPPFLRHRLISNALWECKCDCCNITEIPLYYLRRVNNEVERSCGCLTHEKQVELGKNIDMEKRFGFVEDTSISMLKANRSTKKSTTGYRGVSYLKNGDKDVAG